MVPVAQKVYRHKGHYLVYNIHHEYGPRILQGIPRGVSKEAFEEWVKITGEYVDAQYESLKDPNTHLAEYVTDKQPESDMVQLYEIDLDNLVFHVDSQPLFRLDNMPPEDVFLTSISFDHFGHRAFHEHTPTQFRYNWRAPPPPPSPKSLIAYNSCPDRPSTTSIYELLRTPMALSPIERTRTTLMELLVARCMTGDSVGRDVRVLESAPNRDHISPSMLELALSLVDIAVGPPIPELPYHPPYNPLSNTWDFIWVRKDVCLRITTHLDDEDNLQASIGDLVHYINTTQGKVGTIYGVACSIFHCVVVRVDKDGVVHTPALQFLPSFYARKISTPGIEALSRLGCQCSGVEFLTTISETYKLPCATHKETLITRSAAAKVPVEVWMNVGHYITLPRDLVNLASISPRAMSAAADLVRYPCILTFRLVDVVGSSPLIPETTEITDEESSLDCYHQLGCAKFVAVESGRRVSVELCHTFFPGSRVPYELDIYLSGSDTCMNYPIFIREDEQYFGTGL